MFSPIFRPVTNRHKYKNVTEIVTQIFNSKMVRFKEKNNFTDSYQERSFNSKMVRFKVRRNVAG